jgi:hypothetical protein
MLAVALGGVRPAVAEEWGTVIPGETTIDAVRARFGEPTRSQSVKVEGYDTTEWVYEGTRAPRGIRRLTIDFGLLTPAGYRPDLVRIMRLEPNPGIFTRSTVLMGWGTPTRMGKDKDRPIFFYQDGLLVEFDKDGWLALVMTFTPPQPLTSP